MSFFNSDILDKGVTKGVVDVVVEADDNIDFRDDDGIPERRQIGLFSAVFIIFNRIIGTGWVGLDILQTICNVNLHFQAYSPHRVLS